MEIQRANGVCDIGVQHRCGAGVALREAGSNRTEYGGPVSKVIMVAFRRAHDVQSFVRYHNMFTLSPFSKTFSVFVGLRASVTADLQAFSATRRRHSNVSSVVISGSRRPSRSRDCRTRFKMLHPSDRTYGTNYQGLCTTTPLRTDGSPMPKSRADFKLTVMTEELVHQARPRAQHSRVKVVELPQGVCISAAHFKGSRTLDVLTAFSGHS
jgi:hypothetical protein